MKYRLHKTVWTVVLISASMLGCGQEAADSGSDATTADKQAAEAVPAEPQAEQMEFIAGFAAGQEQAQVENKPMLVFFTAKWCRYCHLMAQETFTDEQVIYLSQRFVCVMVDADREPRVCEAFQINGYPTVQFVSPDGVPLNRVVGKRGPYGLIPEMQAALHAVAQRNAKQTVR